MISVFTPSHDPRWLDQAYASLTAQTDKNWEWVVVLNNGARWAGPPDSRVTVFTLDQLRGVGAAKSFACEQARGEILLELDHDDMLAETAVERVREAFQVNPEASLVYSDTAAVDGELNALPPLYDQAFGWTYGQAKVHAAGEIYDVTVTDSLDGFYPHNASLIWYAPNHLRAFTRDAYDKAGGYDWNRDILDDQDLMHRLFLFGDFHRIPECLYLQRMHTGNTQHKAELNARIQVETMQAYRLSLEPAALAWTQRRGLLALDLGAAHSKPTGYRGVDQHPGPGVDYAGDIFDVLEGMTDGSVGVIRAMDFLEHVADKTRLWNEMHRVLTHGGVLLSMTPSTDGRGAWQDPTHVAGYNENSFWYMTRSEQAAYIPDSTARFHAGLLETVFPSDWHRNANIPYVRANLIADKGGPRMGGLSGW